MSRPSRPRWPTHPPGRFERHQPGLLRAALLVAVALALSPVSTAAQETAAEERETCLTCHADESLTVTFADGTVQSLAVKQDGFLASVHGPNLKCTDCHPTMSEMPHPERTWASRAEFRASFREACKACHFDNYTQSMDGVHHAMQAKGDTRAPWCADCHGGHDIVRAGKPRSAISRTCARCHESISTTYTRSVHGKALIESHNEDVPVCTDCHRSHDIADPRTTSWLLKTPELCGKCHTNEPLMKRYGLSAAVLDTYLSDFHGMTAHLGSAGGTTKEGRVTALCIDCHGVHDITRVDDPSSPVLRANLAKTCQKCHAGAPPTFPAAWLSHYEPSWDRTPLVYSVKVFYAIFIPFVIGGLVLQILLHLWRLVVNR